MSNLYSLIVELRDPEEHERASCNGCHNMPIVKVLEIGSRSHDGRGIYAAQFRLCVDCLVVLRAGVDV